MKKQKTQEPELLQEILGFGSIFGLHFLQSIFGADGEPYDPEFEQFLKDQDELEPIIDKIRDMEDEEMQNPEMRQWLNKAMGEMPDEVQQAASKQFAIEAGEQVNDFQQALGALGVAFKEAAGKLDKIAEKIEADPEALKKIYAKYAGASMKQLIGLWQKFSTAVQKSADSKGKTKVHPETLKAMELDFDTSQFAELLAEFNNQVPQIDTVKPISPTALEEEEVAEPEHWALEFVKQSGIEPMLVKVKEELELLKGFATDEQNIFGIGTQTADGWVSKMEAVFGDISTSLKKRFPNEVAKIAKAGGKRRGARSRDDVASMSQQDRIEMTGNIISAIEAARDKGDKEKLKGLIPQLKTYAPEKVLKDLAKRMPELGLKEHLKRQTFYESFGDFS